jgi:hypothetical protein
VPADLDVRQADLAHVITVKPAGRVTIWRPPARRPGRIAPHPRCDAAGGDARQPAIGLAKSPRR